MASEPADQWTSGIEPQHLDHQQADTGSSFSSKRKHHSLTRLVSYMYSILGFKDSFRELLSSLRAAAGFTVAPDFQSKTSFEAKLLASRRLAG